MVGKAPGGSEGFRASSTLCLSSTGTTLSAGKTLGLYSFTIERVILKDPRHSAEDYPLRALFSSSWRSDRCLSLVTKLSLAYMFLIEIVASEAASRN